MIPGNALLAFDASHWNRLDYSQIAAAGVKALLFKISQGNDIQDEFADDHLAGALDNGMRWLPWHWVDPLDNVSSQVANILDKLYQLNISPRCFGLDVEQYWADWGEYLNNLPITKFIPPSQISDTAYGIARNLQSRGMKIVIYSRAKFIQDFSPQMIGWIDQFYLWWAQWVYSPRPQIRTTWDEFYRSYTPAILYPPFNPQWTGTTRTDVWQWTGDKFILPGTFGGSIDIDFVYHPFFMELNAGSNVPAKYVQVITDASYARIRELSTTNSPEIARTFKGYKLPLLEEEIGADGYRWMKVGGYIRGDLVKKV